jgi:REP-associated tyrosine transposase
MASTLTRILIHITFSTKDRCPLIPENLEEDLYAYTGGICRRGGSKLLAMGGTSDHVHLFVSLAKTEPLSGLLLNIKRDTSRWMKERTPDFAWQDGYFAFSIGESGVEALRLYISGQKEHHKGIDYKDEIRVFFSKYGIEWDERYVWR